ncbi:MAG: hypothetical protein KJ063_02445 [Anaerolineae bacterium]|nr:hypothetical protein [Anaerolineae bacterium]
MEFTKDPQAVLDYKWDWSDWLADGETITSHTVTASGLTLDSHNVSDGNTSVTAWLSGGAIHTKYRVVCTITTNQGRTDERTMIINCLDR